MPQFKTFADKTFKVQDVKTKIKSFEDERPEVEKVTLDLANDKPSSITHKPKKTKTEIRTVEVDGLEMDAEAESNVSVTLSELPEVFYDIRRCLNSYDKVEVSATITRGIFEDKDGSTSKAFFITQQNIGSLEIVDERIDYEDEKSNDKEDENKDEDIIF